MTEADIINKLSHIGADFARDGVDYLLSNIGRFCESPIERIMLAALHASIGLGSGFIVCFCRPEEFDAYNDAMECVVLISPQRMISNYRIDFVIRLPFRNAMFAIECDGHEFHERTKEQAEKDRSRDRAIQDIGIRIFRFTGREIWRDPIKCADEILAAIVKTMRESGESR